jgi:hypothetical protein
LDKLSNLKRSEWKGKDFAHLAVGRVSGQSQLWATMGHRITDPKGQKILLNDTGTAVVVYMGGQDRKPWDAAECPCGSELKDCVQLIMEGARQCS